MTNLTRTTFQAHPFHLVSPSPWPLFTCFSLLFLTTGGVLSMHGFASAQYFFNMALFSLIYSICFWFRDVISKATYLDNHTLPVEKGSSEILHIHSALSPISVSLIDQSTKMYIDAVNSFELPLFNTLIPEVLNYFSINIECLLITFIVITFLLLKTSL